jgi:hypothetical protein
VARGADPAEPRHVLIVCYDFPDIGNSGVIRTYQLAKQLPSFGWQPVILTAEPCSSGREDDIEASDGRLECPRVTVAPPRFLVPFRPAPRAPLPPGDDRTLRANGISSRLGRLASQFAVPDGKLAWWPAAVRRGLRIGREHRVRICFSVSPRPTSHFVARRIARSLGIPWVADFALPWSDADWLGGRPRALRWLDERLERSTVRAAQHITVAYDEIARGLCARQGPGWRTGVSVVPTGFADELIPRGRASLPAKFTVVHPGSHFSQAGRYGECFLRAMDQWIDEEPALAGQVECVVIGKRDADLELQRASMAHPEVIRLEPLVSHRACMQAIRASHAGLVNTIGNRIPAKVYEFMGAGKPILALTEPGSDLERLMRGYAGGIAVPARDTPAIRDALQRLRRTRDSAAPERPETDVPLERYSSRHSALTVARIFDDLSPAPSD